ncbi:acyl-CoA dehydrogenase family protein [Sphingomonas sp. RB3P16]|uniref:acyl-CoA dehydrogenase family protein n=1 Tax=Parasphingomonas frigoris TaxID=3096163 RepID=UPI002FC7ABB4
MAAFAPATLLETHEVTNQPGEFAGRNLFTTDPAMTAAVRREGGAWLTAPLTDLGAAMGSEKVLDLGALANRHPPELVSFDRFGRRLDEARFHPAYHDLMRLAMDHGIHDVAWRARQPGGHVAHAAMLAVFTQAEAGTMCPINMTYASVAGLRCEPEHAKPWIDALVGGTYDAPLRPISDKTGITIGMAMTEKQGGSDVRANTTRAHPLPDIGPRAYRLVGHKWFCSAPMSDAFLTLAYTEGGLSCFLAPRITPDGARNGIHIMRLKDKLGNKSSASSEIEYHDAYAELLGEEGRGVKVIIDMVHHTRLGTISGTIGIMGMALAQAFHHTAGRQAFQRLLIDQPTMTSVLADLAVEYEAAVALTMRIARAFDGADEEERALARIGVAVAKYWTTKRNPNFVYECMECLGGAGYVEESIMPRLYREAPLNAIWEGSGNVIALDILRALSREPGALDAVASELRRAQGGNRRFDIAAEALIARLSKRVPSETEARYVAEQLGLMLQGSLLVRHAPVATADVFVATRIVGEGGRSFGTLPTGTDARTIVDRRRAASFENAS